MSPHWFIALGQKHLPLKIIKMHEDLLRLFKFRIEYASFSFDKSIGEDKTILLDLVKNELQC